jgi:hypothetical protein
MFKTLEEVVNSVNKSERGSKLTTIESINKLSKKPIKFEQKVYMSAYSDDELHKALISSKMIDRYLKYTKRCLEFLFFLIDDSDFHESLKKLEGKTREQHEKFAKSPLGETLSVLGRETLEDFLITENIISEKGETQETHRKIFETILRNRLSEIENCKNESNNNDSQR